LRDLGLVRSVGGKELAARYDRVDQNRPVVMIDARTQKGSVSVGVFVSTGAKIIDNLVLGFAGIDCQRPVQPDFGRQVRKQVFQGIDADRGQHLAALEVRLR
jgi:hypothetical protein